MGSPMRHRTADARVKKFIEDVCEKLRLASMPWLLVKLAQPGKEKLHKVVELALAVAALGSLNNGSALLKELRTDEARA